MFARVGVTVGLLVLLLLAAVAALGCGEQPWPKDFVGMWQETGTPLPYAMQIGSPRDGVYRVTYGRFYPSHGQFRLADGKLTYAAVSPEQTDVITYDAESDSITITSGSTDESHTLARTDDEAAASPGAQPPEWLVETMTRLTRNAGDPDASAWWALTTAEKAVVVEGEDAPTTVANPERPVYVIVVNGDFTRWLWSLPAGTSAPEYSWVFELINAESHVAAVVGNSGAPFDTTGLDLQPVILRKRSAE